MTKKEIYVAFDGKEFDTEAECAKHELDERNKLNLMTKEHVITGGKKVSANDIIEFFTKMRCWECPFFTRCNSLAKHMRAHNTPVLTLCQTVKGTEPCI